MQLLVGSANFLTDRESKEDRVDGISQAGGLVGEIEQLMSLLSLEFLVLVKLRRSRGSV